MPQPISTATILAFSGPVRSTCGDADSSGSELRIIPAPDCNPPQAYDIALTAAIVLTAEAIAFTLSTPSGYTAISATNPFRLRAKDVLTFRDGAGAILGTVTVAETKTFTVAAAQTVKIQPATTAIATGSVALAYLSYVVEGVTNLDVKGNDNLVDVTKVATNGQSSQAVTSRALMVDVSFLVNASDDGLWEGLQPYSTLTVKDVFVTVFMSPGQLAFAGMGNLSSFTQTAAAKEKIRGTVSFNATAPYSQFTLRSKIRDTNRLAYHDAVAEYCMIPLTSFA